MERTLVLLKPDAVKRGFMGKILSRFEDAGLKVIGAKMVWIDKNLGEKHYNDIGKVQQRHGEMVFQALLRFMASGPVMALCLEGVNVVENVRKMCGGTEPKSAAPGTIRGDFSHISYAQADQQGKAIENIVHASGNADEAKQEIALWFKPEELHSYKTVHEVHVF
ncbi:nucleoside-diphosphate kinase [Candidatus Woesearchaeota archaeon]|nr:nucleoside-diphosphate kinase [Candidatus Woesearchaeota archaeon]